MSKSKADFIDGIRARAAAEELLDGPTAARLALVFKALADPTRLRIISLLSEGELCVYDIAAVLGMSQSAISQQLRILRNLLLVRHRRKGRMVYYALDDEHIRTLFRQGMDHVLHGQP